MKNITVQITAAVCCLAAAIISYDLLQKHVAGSSGQEWFEAGCSEEAVLARADCAAVLATPYSYFPPKRPEESSDRWHVPVALLGLLYYSVLFIWVIGVGSPARERRWIHAVPLLLVEFGVPASIYYSAIMFYKLEEWCPWCLVTHILNIIIAACLVLMWPWPTPPKTITGQQESSLSKRASTPRPSARAVFLTVVAIGIASWGNANVFRISTCYENRKTADGNYRRCRRTIDRVKQASGKLLGMWQATEACELMIRPDDAIRLPGENGADQQLLDIVVFSDFECPSCAKFSDMLDHRIMRLFGDQLRVIYRHYPLGRRCNQEVRQTSHPHACIAARMAESMRQLEGNEGFWRAHDFLQENRKRLMQGELDAPQLAAALGMDLDALRTRMESQETMARISDDARQARRCGVFATPGVFVEGKAVDPLAILEIGFWDKMADHYWQRIAVPRPEAAKLSGIWRSPK